MSIKQYSFEEEESCTPIASEPSIQEIINTRRFPLSEAMKSCVTLEESRKIMEERIYKHYHPEE